MRDWVPFVYSDVLILSLLHSTREEAYVAYFYFRASYFLCTHKQTPTL